jgi:hypothetical protein
MKRDKDIAMGRGMIQIGNIDKARSRNSAPRIGLEWYMFGIFND